MHLRPLLALLVVAACGDGPSSTADAASALDAASSRADLAGSPDLAAPATTIVYVSGGSPQIARFRFDAAAGALLPLGATPSPGLPSFLAVSPTRGHLYAVDETGNQVAAFSIAPGDGALTPLGAVSSGGSGPAHLVVDHGGRFVLIAHYGDGTVALLPRLGDGRLAAATGVRLAGQNAHQIVLDGQDRFVFVPCLGSDWVAQYALDAPGMRLVPSNPATMPTAAGAGPRHLALHPDGTHAYLLDEIASTISALTVDGGGHLAIVQTLSTRRNGATGGSSGAEVVVHPSGRFVWASNRGDDDLAGFALDAQGRMAAVGHTPTGGATPRSFAIDKSGRWLLVGNQGSDEVRLFAVDGASGALTATATRVTAPAPEFVGFVELP